MFRFCILMSFKFQLQGAELVACSTGALWWPEARLLTVADLHLGRAERLARLVQIWDRVPSLAETVARLDAVTAADVCGFAAQIAAQAPMALALYGPVAGAPDLARLQEQRAA